MDLVKTLALFLSIIMAGIFVSSAFADDCDPAFTGAEGFLCKMGRVEHKVGLKTDERLECVELKPVAITGCTVEPMKTDAANQILYLAGNKAMKDALRGFEWQCDVRGGNGKGGMEKTSFEGYWHPSYTIDKFPGESNADRNNRFLKDMEKNGKYVLTAVGIENPLNEYNKKFDNQVCQYFNVKTNKVAFKFNCNVNFGKAPEKK